jgi:hypothetical protein
MPIPMLTAQEIIRSAAAKAKCQSMRGILCVGR